MATTAVPTPGNGSRAGTGVSSLGYGFIATLPPPRRLPAITVSRQRSLHAPRTTSVSAGNDGGSCGLGFGFGASFFGTTVDPPASSSSATGRTSAPPRARGEGYQMMPLLSPAGGLPSPPRTDPPRRRHRKKGNSRYTKRGQVPDSPLPLPPGQSRKGLLRDASAVSLGSDLDLTELEQLTNQTPRSVAKELEAVPLDESPIPPPSRRARAGYPAGPEQDRSRFTGVGQATLVIDTEIGGASSEDEVEEEIEGEKEEHEVQVTLPEPTQQEAVRPPNTEEEADLDQMWEAQDGLWKPAEEEQKRGLTEEDLAKNDELGPMRARSDCDYWDNSSHLDIVSNGVDSVNSKLKRGEGAITPSLQTPSLGASRNFTESQADDLQSSTQMLAAGTVKGGAFTWVRGELIGRGSLGSVWKALNSRTGELMAVKEVVLDPRDSSENKFRQSLQNEIDLYKDLQHPNIVSYLGNDFINGRLYIYLEYMSGGSISQVLSQFGPIDESLMARYLKGLLQGLDYLHTREHPVLHRDIKGANILVGLDRSVQLSDFGCSKRTGGTANHTLRGSVPWMAPEVMRQSGYGRKADIWSLGCVLIEMSTASPPWGQFDNCLAAMVRIAMSEETPPVPEKVSPLLRDLIITCTRRSPEERPSASQLLEHDFLKVCQDDCSAIDESWGS